MIKHIDITDLAPQTPHSCLIDLHNCNNIISGIAIIMDAHDNQSISNEQTFDSIRQLLNKWEDYDIQDVISISEDNL